MLRLLPGLLILLSVALAADEIRIEHKVLFSGRLVRQVVVNTDGLDVLRVGRLCVAEAASIRLLVE